MTRAIAIGLMSGTSYDGVDVALIETDGEEIGRLSPTGYRPYSDRERDVVRRAIAVAASLTDRKARPAMLAAAEELVTDMHAEAVEAFLAANGMAPSEVAVVGFHGQTVLHRPDRGLTIQLGHGAALADRLGIPVVYDFRAADVAAGGHGAPMVPVFHRAMLRLLKRPHPVGVLNLGGVANVTFINGNAELVACDTGPGNALIDDFVRLRTGQPQDDEGRAAAAGRMDRRRRRYAQSDIDANVGGAPRPRAGRDRERSGLVGRCARGAGLRLSCGAHASGFAAHLSHHNRRAAAADRRHPGAAVGGASRLAQDMVHAHCDAHSIIC